MTVNWSDLAQFDATCEAVGLTTPAPLIRGLALHDVAMLHTLTPTVRLLDLTDGEARDRITDLAFRSHSGELTGADSRGVNPGVQQFDTALAQEVREAILPHLDDLVAELQPRFTELVRPLVTAAQTYGFTSRTRSDDVIDLADEAASAAWRGSRVAIQAIMPIVRFRIAVSRIFGVSPTIGETLRSRFTGPFAFEDVNQSVAFAEEENWSYENGYYIEGRAGQGHLDWLALAGGGLRLNTPTETRAKITARPFAIPEAVNA